MVYAENSLLMGDEVVDLMMEYAVLLARQASADSVDVAAISAGGDEVTATFLIGPATIMVAETSRSALPEPENGSAVSYLKEKIEQIKSPPMARGLRDDDERGFEEGF